VPKPCPAGSYCEQGVQSPDACREHTYSTTLEADTHNTCEMCPAGYYCTDLGTSNYTIYPCQSGHYCLDGCQAPTECPLGSYSLDQNVASSQDCPPCPASYYCPTTTTKLEAQLGTFCPEGSVEETLCPLGYYCPALAAAPILCPQGYYCPLYNLTYIN